MKIVTMASVIKNLETKSDKLCKLALKELKNNFVKGQTYHSTSLDTAFEAAPENIRMKAIEKMNAGGWNARIDWINVPVEGKKVPEAKRTYLFGE